MLTSDYIIVGVFVFFAILGIIVGFGRGLKFFTSGIFGLIISLFVTYLFFGVFAELEFVKNLLGKLNDWLISKGSVGNFFHDIHLDYIVLAIVLFIITQIVRFILVRVIRGFMESENGVVKVINKTLGAILFVGVAICLMLIVFAVIEIIGGETALEFYDEIDGSFFALDKIFLNNPLSAVLNLSSIKNP